MVVLAASDLLTRLAIIAALIVIVGIVILVPVMVVRSMRRQNVPGTAGAMNVLDVKRQACYAKATAKLNQWLESHPGQNAGPQVDFEFHTYTGGLMYTHQHEHRERLPSVAARFLLSELHWLNVGHISLSHGAVLIPFLSFINYRRQLARIRRAEHEVGFVAAR